MNKNQPNNQEDQEIDLMQISRKIGRLFEWINTFLFKCIKFFVKNAIVILILLVIGVGLGFYLDVTKKTYDHQIIVTPNFESTDYLYSKIELIESKIKEGDTVFLKEIVGIKKPKEIIKIEIKPITDVYKFIENKTENFELIKLMAEGGDIKKILEDNLTSKNYTYHTIFFSTDELVSDEEKVLPLLNYLNDSEYYNKIQDIGLKNLKQEIAQNDTIIAQINSVLDGFSNNVKSVQKNDKLVYYNENTQLNDVIKTKQYLIGEQGKNRVKLVSYDKIIKEINNTLNIQNTKSVNGKLKFGFPILFLFSFILIHLFIGFYRKQSVKANLSN